MEVRDSSQTRFDIEKLAVFDSELDDALKALFRGKCAFCEKRSDALRAYRFRPTDEAGPSGAAAPEDANRSHLYYVWLINSWQNIYPICPECSPLEPSIFPTFSYRCPIPSLSQIVEYANSSAGSWPYPPKERPRFLDPCAAENFRRNLAAVPSGELVSLSSRGDATLHQFNLNRKSLVDDRSKVFQERIEGLFSTEYEDLDGLFDFSSLEFGGSWYLLLNQIAKKVAPSNRRLSAKLLPDFFIRNFDVPEFATRLRAASRDLAERPDQIFDTTVRDSEKYRDDARPVSFSISNFKGIENLEITIKSQNDRTDSDSADRAIVPALVILGDNATGKSSILEAIALALGNQRMCDDLGLDARSFMLNPSMMGTSHWALPRRAKVKVRYENGKSVELHINDSFRFNETDDIARIPVFAYGAFRLFMKEERRRRHSAHVRSLFYSNYILPNPEPWLVSIWSTPLFSEVARALKSILSIDEDIDIIEVDPERRECLLLQTMNANTGSPVKIRTPLASVSSGFRAVLAMVCDIMRGLIAQQDALSASLAKARAIVLIDEVEAHLHPKWKMHIIRGLREALPNVTFIMTTHDPLCLRGLNAEEVKVFRRVELPNVELEELQTSIEEVQELPTMGALTIEQLLTSDFFDLRSTDSPEIEMSFARGADLLAKSRAGLELADTENGTLANFRKLVSEQIGKSVPVGSTEVERLIQEAVEIYLIQRRDANGEKLKKLRDTTRQSILMALRKT